MANTLALMHPQPQSQAKKTATKDRSEKPCLCCEKKFRPKKPWQDFCKPECKLISWCANQFLKAFKAGRADGLKNIIQELSTAGRESEAAKR
jgi:hypothetical protein